MTSASEDHFEQSADMRLIELQREQLGFAKPTPSAWQTKAVADLPFAPTPEPPPLEAGPVLSLQTTATPSTGLIPGAVVTVGLSVINEGGKPGHEASIRLPLPSAMSYWRGSLQIDGRAASEDQAEELFGKGLPLGTLAASQRVTLLLKLMAKASPDDPVLSPSLSSADAAVVGAKAVRLERKRTTTAFAAAVSKEAPAEQPFYELEPEEEIVYEAGEAAIASAARPALVAPPGPIVPPAPIVPSAAIAPPPAAPLLVPPPSTAPASPAPALPPAEPGATEAPAPAEPAPVEPPRTAPVQVSPHREAPRVQRITERALMTTLEKSKIATLGQFFAATRSFGMVAHYLLLSALACSRTLPPEESRDEIAAFFAAQDALLTRALVAKRLGKSIAIDDVAAPLPAFPPEIPESAPLPERAPANALVLLRTFSGKELDFVGRAVGNTGSPPFTRAGQLSVGLCAKTVIATDRSKADVCERALEEYAAAASSEINRLFVRARLDKRTDLFGPSNPSLDARARAVLAALTAVA